MLVEMPARDRGVRGIEPFHLGQSRSRGLEVRGVDGASLVVVGEVPYLSPVGRDLDDGEGGVREPVDTSARPFFGDGGRCHERR